LALLDFVDETIWEKLLYVGESPWYHANTIFFIAHKKNLLGQETILIGAK